MKLIISNLDPSIKAADLQAVLEEFGPVRHVSMEEGALDSIYAIVEMVEAQAAHNVMNFLQGDIINGKSIQIKVYQVHFPKAGTDSPSLSRSEARRVAEKWTNMLYQYDQNRLGSLSLAYV